MADGNPYPGPRSFQEEDGAHFSGRDREARELLALVASRRAVLLHSPSGAGKTSLIQARLVPDLRKRRGTAVLPVARVGGQTMAGAANVFVANAMQWLFDLDAEEAAGFSLADGLARALDSLPDSAGRICLLFDQFEEIFTGPADLYAQREDFFRQLRDVLDRQPRLSLFLSMREDFVAALEPYLPFLPDRLSTRMRLDLLDAKAAGEAVSGPVKDICPFTAEARDYLIDNLRQGGPYVEPILLQVVCRRLWERLPPGTREIDRHLLVEGGDVQQALEEFYQNAVTSVAKEKGVQEGVLRDWIGVNLITKGGIRNQVLAEGGKVAGLDEAVVRALETSRLVRCETRRGVPFYELAHDRLVSPARRNNESWSWERKLVEAAGERRSRWWALGFVLILLAGLGLMAYSVADWILLRGLDLKVRGLEDTQPDLALLLAAANAEKQFETGNKNAARAILVGMIQRAHGDASGDLTKEACRLAGRKLKEGEWCEYIGPSIFSPVCGDKSHWYSWGPSFRCVNREVPNYFQHVFGHAQSALRKFQ